MKISYCVPLLLGLCTDAAASQPAPEYDVCDPVQPGNTILEARILSFEEPRYTCGPYDGPTDGWMEVLDSQDSRHARLQPTATTGCILASTSGVGLDDRGLDDRPIDDPIPGQIEVRVDGATRAVRYEYRWAVCGLAPGHHAIEMDTDRGPLTCDGEVRAGETLTLAATSYGVILQIEPTRLVAGVPRAGQRLTVEYDESNIIPHMPLRHHDGFPPKATLRLWTSPEGVLHAERCPPPPAVRVSLVRPSVAPRAVPASGCAHCAAGETDPSQSMFAALLVALCLVSPRRRCAPPAR